MKPEALLKLYQQDSHVQLIAEKFQQSSSQTVQIKNLAGSLGAVLVAAIDALIQQPQLFILNNKEEAAYFYTDLQHLLPKKTIFFYPAAQQQPDTNKDSLSTPLLRRTETLYHMGCAQNPAQLIVTYPAALTEKLIPKALLQQHALTLAIGNTISMAAFTEQLVQQGFEKKDAVYEAGEFAVKGGIIDIFSYAHQLPYRIALWGNTIESMRTFNPTDQRSIEETQEAAILGSTYHQQASTATASFLDFLQPATKIWLKDYELILATLEESYQKAVTSQQTHTANQTSTAATTPLEQLFETPASWEKVLQKFTKITFGQRSYLQPTETFSYEATGQPDFHQNFDLLAENLHQNESEGLKNMIAAASESQLDRLATIFQERNENVTFQNLNLGLSQGYVDRQVGIACYTEHQLFNRYYRYQSAKKYTSAKAITLKALQTLQPGDYVVHIDHGIGRFAGLHTMEVSGTPQEAVRLLYKDGDLVYVSVHALHHLSKYADKEGTPPQLDKLGSPAWANKKQKAKKKVKDIAKDLIALYGKRKKAPGFAFSKDNFMQAELESSFMYEDTPDQATATADVKKDMETAHPMDRLICGDVGFGKTEVAMRAAFKAVSDSKQVAVLAPTTILTLQHAESFRHRLANFPVKIAYINRFKSAKEKKEILQATAAGQVDVLIGTHGILSKKVTFKDLGLLIVDEEQKFGVKAKERLKELKVNVDVLTLTATPIPRTLHFSLMGARDISIIGTPPPNRKPVETALHAFNKTIIKEAVQHEMQRGGQIFFVHNRVTNIIEVAHMIGQLVPNAKIGIAHGKMQGNQLEKTMLQFIQGEYDVLVSTNIIESGLDIPNANTIIIHDAHMFGLSDLHQMRGRVGRSNKKAFCYLLAPPTSTLTTEAQKRLAVLEEFSDLGDGFKVAMRDLDIRGTGNLLGAEQSGFMADLGFGTYHKILNDAVQELKEDEFKDLFSTASERQAQLSAPDCIIETDLATLIPITYIRPTTERFSIYRKLNEIHQENALQNLKNELKDRFGPLPDEVKMLMQLVQLRWLANRLRINKVHLKHSVLKCYFPASQSQAYANEDTFKGILDYVQQHPNQCNLKSINKNLILTLDNINHIDQAQKIFTTMSAKEPALVKSKV